MTANQPHLIYSIIICFLENLNVFSEEAVDLQQYFCQTQIILLLRNQLKLLEFL